MKDTLSLVSKLANNQKSLALKILVCLSRDGILSADEAIELIAQIYEGK